MKWQEVALTTSADAAEAAANVFFEVGVNGVVIEDSGYPGFFSDGNQPENCNEPDSIVPGDTVVIKGYMAVDDCLQEKMQLFHSKISGLGSFFEGYSAEIDTEEVAEEDWASSWKKFFKTTRVGERTIVKPAWEEYTPMPEEIVVEIDPGSAFGTGTHATTTTCLKVLERYVEPGQIVFDVGCGSGILSIASVKLGAFCAYARDIDPVAVQAAKRNGAANGFNESLEVEAGNFLDGVKGRAHCIVANIVSESIIEFCPQAFSRLIPGGKFIASGIIEKRKIEVMSEIEKSGFEIIEEVKESGWVTVVAQRK